ncbi:MAG: SDR family oxidoreductase [Gemmatimonadales bacterium]|nr:MAG: SDR family oxidoreductase [Gemmatimonadales bacterium]
MTESNETNSGTPSSEAVSNPSSEPVTVLVIGGSGGIGGALVDRLLRGGHHVVATGRDEDRLSELAEADRAGGDRLQTRVLANAADFDALDELVSEVASGGKDRGAPLRGLANCAGSILLKPAHLTTADDFRETLEQNLHTAFSAVRAAGRHMRKGGSVVLFSSGAARMGLQSHEAVAAAKAGVEGLVRAAAATYAARNLRVNGVAPGLVDTPLASRILGTDAGRKASESLHALGRLGEPDDVAGLAAFLLDPKNDWITGQVMGVDGGLGSVRSRG